MPFDDEDRIFRPANVPNTLFNPFLPDVSSLKALVAPLYDDNDAKTHAASLQAAMQLNNDTLLFAKIVVSTCQLFRIPVDCYPPRYLI